MDQATPPKTPPPSQAAPSAYDYAASDERPRGAREEELCAKASHFDYLYGASLVALDVASLLADADAFQLQAQPGVRLIGPALVGMTWGATLSGLYLSLPKCSPGLVASQPPEGNVHESWPLAFAIALVSGATAPLIVGVETGTGLVTLQWPVWERSSRLVVAGVGGFVGALLPYLIPPKTRRAAKELENIRAGADARGAWLSYTASF